jgi:hypothetical protein
MKLAADAILAAWLEHFSGRPGKVYEEAIAQED